jgi:hypothetical protein
MHLTTWEFGLVLKAESKKGSTVDVSMEVSEGKQNIK